MGIIYNTDSTYPLASCFETLNAKKKEIQIYWILPRSQASQPQQEAASRQRASSNSSRQFWMVDKAATLSATIRNVGRLTESLRRQY